jgi:hypothetical protein
MKMTILPVWMFASALLLNSCEKEDLLYTSGDIEITVETGDHWLHDFPLFMGLTKKNPPQLAIWIEDVQGNYLSTVFVTYKIATEGWQANKGNRRKESLPHWCYQRGVVYEDGLLLPTKATPLADGITGATPKGDKRIQIRPGNLGKPFVVKAEFNHSVDFNDFYPEHAREGEANYSGGKEGSGQPAVVYAATVYPDTREAIFECIGNSSPDGSNGDINPDLQGLTTAKSIVKRIKLTIK